MELAALNRCGAEQRTVLLGVLLERNVQCQTNNTVRQQTGEAVNKTPRHTVIRLDLLSIDCYVALNCVLEKELPCTAFLFAGLDLCTAFSEHYLLLFRVVRCTE